jgi:alcohol dehydrogenase class IV
MNINFCVPTDIILGKECVKNNSQKIAAMGNHAFLVTGGKSAKMNGALNDVTEVLRANNQTWMLFDKVTPNPTKEQALSGAQIAKDAGSDFIIAIGGGSPMDAGKAIAYYFNRTNENVSQALLPAERKVLPIIAIPTTAGTGSEVTPYAILTDHEKETKAAIATPEIFPKHAMLDARYMLSLGTTTTINTAIDALSHAVEGMLSNKGNALTNIIASEALRIITPIIDNLEDVSNLDIEKREQLLYASMLAGAVIANTGTTGMHSMGYSLTYFKDIDHGRANGLLMAEFLRFVEKSMPNLTDKILYSMGIRSIDSLGKILSRLLGESEKIKIEEFEKFSSVAIKAWNIKNCAVVPTKSDLTEIYKSSFIK